MILGKGALNCHTSNSVKLVIFRIFGGNREEERSKNMKNAGFLANVDKNEEKLSKMKKTAKNMEKN